MAEARGCRALLTEYFGGGDDVMEDEDGRRFSGFLARRQAARAAVGLRRAVQRDGLVVLERRALRAPPLSTTITTLPL